MFLASTEPKMFASEIAVCTDCGAHITSIVQVNNEPSRLQPCGHRASVTFIPNPLLGDVDA